MGRCRLRTFFSASLPSGSGIHMLAGRQPRVLLWCPSQALVGDVTPDGTASAEISPRTYSPGLFGFWRHAIGMVTQIGSQFMKLILSAAQSYRRNHRLLQLSLPIALASPLTISGTLFFLIRTGITALQSIAHLINIWRCFRCGASRHVPEVPGSWTTLGSLC